MVVWGGLLKSESEVTELCPTLCDPMDCSLSGFSVHGIFQASVLEWIAISFSRGSSQPRNRTQVSRIAGRLFTVWATLYGDQPRQHIKKQSHYFINQGPSSQGYGFFSSDAWVWELDYKDSWAPKNWCFWTVVLEKAFESPLDCKEIQPVHAEGVEWRFWEKARRWHYTFEPQLHSLERLSLVSQVHAL